MTTRASVRRERRIGRPVEVVWEVIGRPDLLHLWYPGIEACEVRGDVRTITLATGMTLEERILTLDPVQRRFQYRVTGGLFQEHLATVDALDLGDHTTLAVYSTDAAPATMALVLGGGAGAALDELARQLEAATGPAVDAVRAGPHPSSAPHANHAEREATS